MADQEDLPYGELAGSSADTIVFNSSPSVPSSRGSIRQKKPPPVTPRRFNRFFNPRSSTSSTSGRQLRDITHNGSNIQASRPVELDFDDIEAPPSKRQRPESLESSPLRSSPISDLLRPKDHSRHVYVAPRKVERSRMSRLVSQDAYGQNGSRATLSLPTCLDERLVTSRFCSTETDFFSSSQGVPFCVTACNTNSLVAVGDEQGTLHVLDSAKDSTPGFHKAYITMQTHGNAIMDMAFSSDDLMLITSSGDQSSEVRDMRSQKVISILKQHTSSVKQAKFQPGNDSIIATCSRDGSVAIWDLRAKGGPVLPLNHMVPINGDSNITQQAQGTGASLSGLIPSAHRHQPKTWNHNPPLASITSVAFLPDSKSHLLLTASEANSIIKLWDIRGKFKPNHRHNTISTPVSSTAPLASHKKYRPYGLTSLTLSTDGARLYSVCRDSTVYAYSTNHLIMGSAPEFNPQNRVRFNQLGGADGKDKESAGALFGLRNPAFHASSFYVRSSLRKTTGAGLDEILAVGSSNDCAVLFPTNERMLEASAQRRAYESLDPLTVQQNTPSRLSSLDNIPVYITGTPLLRGHTAEVTSLTWTSEGELVTVGDDRLARCWRESDPNKARELRTGGEGGGNRWACGYASVDSSWDEEEG